MKTRYKELAKRHHPDANGGSRDAEERLKTINLAYAALRSRLGAGARRRRPPDDREPTAFPLLLRRPRARARLSTNQQDTLAR